MTPGKLGKRGHITKEGRRDVRGVMVEAGCRAVDHHPHWKAQFERLTRRIGKQKAIVAIARKLLVTIAIGSCCCISILTNWGEAMSSRRSTTTGRPIAWKSGRSYSARRRRRRVSKTPIRLS